MAALSYGMAHADLPTTDYTYAEGNELSVFGTGKAEVYNVAIDLSNPAFVGKEVTAIKVPMKVAEYYTQMVDGEAVDMPCVTGFSMWMTTQLGTETNDAGTKVNITNIASYDVEVPEVAGAGLDGYAWVELTLPEAYTITGEGLFVGYSFTVEKVTDDLKKPVYMSPNPETGGFYLFTSRTYKSWNDRSKNAGGVSALSVTLQGDFPADGAYVSELEYGYYKANEEVLIPATITNAGLSAISSIDYTVTVADATESYHMDLDIPIPAKVTAAQTVDFTIPATPAGAYDVTVAIVKVNGQDNGVVAETTTMLPFVDTVPKHLSLVEEYTGTWCGWCPRGFVAMEEMSRLYPDFPGIAYHNGDPMAMKDGDPNMVSGYPSSYVNRISEVDPYYANGNDFAMPEYWESCNEEFTPVAIEIEAEYDDDTDLVNIKTTLNWVAIPEKVETNNYRLEYVLVADGLTGSGSGWTQSNYFAGYSQGTPYLLEEFAAATSSVTGLVFNDVAILTSGIKGIDGSIPEISTETPTVHEYSFDATQALNTSNKLIPYHKDMLKVVGFILYGANKGKVLNAAKCKVAYYGNDKNIAIDADNAVAVSYYDLQGREITRPSGLCIRVNRAADGTVTSEKVIIK